MSLIPVLQWLDKGLRLFYRTMAFGTDLLIRKEGNKSIGYLSHPFKKTELACPITIIPGHGTRLRDKENLFFSLSERGKLHQARTTDTFCQQALRKTIWMPSERSPFEGIWTNDDDTLAQLDPLMHGHLGWVLFKPPFGSHGAVRPRSE